MTEHLGNSNDASSDYDTSDSEDLNRGCPKARKNNSVPDNSLGIVQNGFQARVIVSGERTQPVIPPTVMNRAVNSFPVVSHPSVPLPMSVSRSVSNPGGRKRAADRSSDEPAKRTRSDIRNHLQPVTVETKDTSCSCAISATWKTNVLRSDFSDHALLVREVLQLHHFDCNVHRESLMSKLNVRMSPDFLQRLQRIADRLEAGDSLETIRKSIEYAHWFHYTREEEADRRANTLGSFKFGPDRTSATLSARKLTFEPKVLSQETIENFPAIPNTVLQINSRLKPIWFHDDIKALAKIEFECHLHHSRVFPEGARKGVINAMVFSILQQLIRSDPLVYLANVMLRPDRETQLMAYPCHAKILRPEDFEERRHIPSHSEDYRSINDEIFFDNASGNVARPWFRSTFEEWKKSRPLSNEGLESEALDRFMKSTKCSWTRVNVKAGDCLFTPAWLPTSFRYQASETIRSVSASLFAISKDGFSLENGASVEEVARSHSSLREINLQDMNDPDMLSSPRIPHQPFPFPPAIRLPHLGYVSDALIGVRSWQDPMVRKERDEIIDSDFKSFVLFYKNWVKHALSVIQEAMSRFEELERELYGGRSYFKLLGDYPGGLKDFPVLLADEEMLQPTAKSSNNEETSKVSSISGTSTQAELRESQVETQDDEDPAGF